MTIDAMHWVWNHSRSKGNVRIVLLAVADKVTDSACVTRIGTTEFRLRLGNVDKSVVVRTVDRALLSGELKELEPARGTIPAKYWLPFAANYTRPVPGSRGGDSPPVASEQGWRSATPMEDARGGDSPPEGWQIATPPGGDLPPLNQQTTPTRSESKLESETAPVAVTIPDFAQPLIAAVDLAGYDTLRWNLKPAEWLIVHALIKSHGIDRLARYAIEQCSQRQISYGKYFLPGWRDLHPAPTPNPDGTPRLAVVPTRTATTRYDREQKAVDDQFDRAMQRARARRAEREAREAQEGRQALEGPLL